MKIFTSHINKIMKSPGKLCFIFFLILHFGFACSRKDDDDRTEVKETASFQLAPLDGCSSAGCKNDSCEAGFCDDAPQPDMPTAPQCYPSGSPSPSPSNSPLVSIYPSSTPYTTPSASPRPSPSSIVQQSTQPSPTSAPPGDQWVCCLSGGYFLWSYQYCSVGTPYPVPFYGECGDPGASPFPSGSPMPSGVSPSPSPSPTPSPVPSGGISGGGGINPGPSPTGGDTTYNGNPLGGGGSGTDCETACGSTTVGLVANGPGGLPCCCIGSCMAGCTLSSFYACVAACAQQANAVGGACYVPPTTGTPYTSPTATP